MTQLKFLQYEVRASVDERRRINVIRGIFFALQTLLLCILILLSFFDFWNISARGSMVWIPLALNLISCSILIFSLVSIKNEVEEANRWYTTTTLTLAAFLALYLLYAGHVIPINKADAYIFAPSSPFRDNWNETQYWYESNIQAPRDFPFAFWIGATMEGLFGTPAGQVLFSITLLLIILLVIGGVSAIYLPKHVNKRFSQMVYV